MVQIIYTSRVSSNVSFDDVARILTFASKNNSEKNITGMMLYSPQYFMQCIEGEKSAIEELMQKILKDKRHHDIHIYGSKSITQRDFTAWNLGYLSYSSAVHKIICESTSKESYLPYELNYEEAVKLLKRLSLVI